MSNNQRPAGGSTQCPHSDIHYHLNNSCFGNTNLHYLEISAKCTICDLPMVFRGVPFGMNPNHPTASIDGQSIMLPFLGENEGLVGEPIGYSVKVGG